MDAELSASLQSSPIPDAMVDSDVESHLDDQILAIRTEIAKLRAHKSRLSSALLGSSKVQKCIQARKLHARNTQTQNSNDNDATLQKRLEEAIETQQNENDVKIHRLAYGITAFPFTDPSPERAGEPTLTGVRFDLGRTKFDARNADDNHVNGGNATATETETESYFVILRRTRHQSVSDGDRANMTYLKVHHHTIPAHINLEALASKYLSLPPDLQDSETMDVNGGDAGGHDVRAQSESFHDDSGVDVTQDIIIVGDRIGTAAAAAAGGGTGGGGGGSNVNGADNADTSWARIRGNGQNFHNFVFAIRDDLQAWQNRVQSIAYLRQFVGLPPQASASSVAAENEQITVPSAVEHGGEVVPKYAISDLVRTTADGYQIRIVWSDDALGLLKLSYEGFVDRAVVYGVSKTMDRATEEVDEQVDVQHERLCDVERMLTLDKAGGKMHVHHLLDGLKRCEELFSDG